MATLKPPPPPGAKIREDDTLRGIPTPKRKTDDEITGVGPDPRLAHEAPTPLVGAVAPAEAPRTGAPATLRPAPFMPVPAHNSQPASPAPAPAAPTLAPGAPAAAAPAPVAPADSGADEGKLELDAGGLEFDELAELAATTLPPVAKSWSAWPAPSTAAKAKPPRPAPDSRATAPGHSDTGRREPAAALRLRPQDAGVSSRAPASAPEFDDEPISLPRRKGPSLAVVVTVLVLLLGGVAFVAFGGGGATPEAKPIPIPPPPREFAEPPAPAAEPVLAAPAPVAPPPGEPTPVAAPVAAPEPPAAAAAPVVAAPAPAPPPPAPVVAAPVVPALKPKRAPRPRVEPRPRAEPRAAPSPSQPLWQEPVIQIRPAE